VTTPGPLRKDYRDAIALIARAAGALVRRGISAPILVGGAAAEFYTGGAITTGDFDFVTAYRDEFFQELEAVGFERAGTGQVQRALFHPVSGLSVEVVSGSLMDGRADLTRVLTVKFRDGDLRIVSIEDMIADRVGQALAGPRIDPRMQEQAISLYRLAGSIDRAYLDKRIVQDSVDQATIATLEAWDSASR
jgi:hypothetical protein